MKNSQFNFINANIFSMGCIVSENLPFYMRVLLLLNFVVYMVMAFWWAKEESKPFDPSVEMLLAVKKDVEEKLRKKAE